MIQHIVQAYTINSSVESHLYCSQTRALFQPEHRVVMRNLYGLACCQTSSLLIFKSLNVEAVALHATPILLDHALAVPLRIVAIREEHTLVSGGFFVLANAAWLAMVSKGIMTYPVRQMETQGMKVGTGAYTFTFATAVPEGFKSDARFDVVGEAGFGSIPGLKFDGERNTCGG